MKAKIALEKTFQYYIDIVAEHGAMFVMNKKVYIYIDVVCEHFSNNNVVKMVVVREMATAKYKILPFDEYRGKEVYRF